MENSNFKPVAAILVDYDYYSENPRVRAFVEHRRNRASIVCLVGTPGARVPSDEEFETFDVVITNSNGQADEDFKFNVLKSLSMNSNLYPAVAIDQLNEWIYDEAGTLIYLGGETFG